MNPNTKYSCAGYCGGKVKIKNMRAIGADRMCPECYEKAKELESV